MFNVMHGLSFRVFRMARRVQRGQPLPRLLEIQTPDKGQAELEASEAKQTEATAQAEQAAETSTPLLEKP